MGILNLLKYFFLCCKGRSSNMMIFERRSFWKDFRVSHRTLQKKYRFYFGEEIRTIDNREESVSLLMSISNTIQTKMTQRIKNESTYAMLLKLYFIFGEVHSYYLKEKEIRLKVVKNSSATAELTELFENNRNIQRNIIDACNIWIENCVLLQHDVNIQNLDVKKEFVMDEDLLIDLYIYGLVSQAISLLMLSKDLNVQNTFYGLDIILQDERPAEVLKYHPIIYFDTVITGNQSDLVDMPLTTDANDTDFGRGFASTNKVEFLLWLAVLHSFQQDQLREDDKALTVISKERFIELCGSYTNPPVDGESCYDSFVLTKEKLRQHLRKNEEIIWVIGANKYRHEIRPFIGLEDGNVLINYGALEQAKQLWVSYFSNGGMCYTNPNKIDELRKAMEKRNEDLSENILVGKLQEILRANYAGTIDLKDVDYQRIFGPKDKNYGDYDIVFYAAEKKELFLIESKYFSDSLNSSGLVNDYNKMFGKGGYYTHCRERYDLVMSEPEKMKAFINETDDISVHMLFISSKPIEMEFQDPDCVVTFLSLGIFEKYIKGNLISEDGSEIMRPVHMI